MRHGPSASNLQASWVIARVAFRQCECEFLRLDLFLIVKKFHLNRDGIDLAQTIESARLFKSKGESWRSLSIR